VWAETIIWPVDDLDAKRLENGRRFENTFPHFIVEIRYLARNNDADGNPLGRRKKPRRKRDRLVTGAVGRPAAASDAG